MLRAVAHPLRVLPAALCARAALTRVAGPTVAARAMSECVALVFPCYVCVCVLGSCACCVLVGVSVVVLSLCWVVMREDEVPPCERGNVLVHIGWGWGDE